MPAMLSKMSSFLLAIDLQQRLVPAIANPHALIKRATALLHAARLLSIPRLFTEHCADRIGPTLPSLIETAQPATIVNKTHFAVTREANVLSQLQSLGRPQAILLGTEAHVCVLQSAIGLTEQGFDVFLVTDAIGSRHDHDRDCAIDRATKLNMTQVTTEMVLFEWLEHGDHQAFRELLPTIRDLGDASVRSNFSKEI